MPQAGRSVTRIQDQDDFGGGLTDSYFLKWVAASSQFQLFAVSALVVDTEANILASSPTDNTFAFASDVKQAYLWDTSDWYKLDIQFQVNAAAPNMGYSLPADSAQSGYGVDYVTDKRLTNVILGGNDLTQAGAIRVDATNDPDTLEIYLGGTWSTILYDLTYANSEFEHTPVDEVIDVWSGNSNRLGFNGIPLVQEYKVSMGCFPFPRTLDGGTF